MGKQFTNKERFDQYVENLENSGFEEMLNGKCLSEKDIVAALLKDGYVDLNNLIADGHAYQIDGHTNNGWVWEDEADLDYIKASGRNTKIRRRELAC